MEPFESTEKSAIERDQTTVPPILRSIADFPRSGIESGWLQWIDPIVLHMWEENGNGTSWIGREICDRRRPNYRYTHSEEHCRFSAFRDRKRLNAAKTPDHSPYFRSKTTMEPLKSAEKSIKIEARLPSCCTAVARSIFEQRCFQLILLTSLQYILTGKHNIINEKR